MLQFLDHMTLGAVKSDWLNAIPPHTLLTRDAYISPFGKVITTLTLEKSLKDRTDFISVVYGNDELVLLTASGELYTEDGTLLSKNITSFAYIERVYVSHFYDHRWVFESGFARSQLPSLDAEQLTCSNLRDGFLFLTKGVVCLRWSEDSKALALYRSWLTEVAPLMDGDLMERYHFRYYIPAPEVIRGIVTGDNGRVVFLIGNKILYRVIFKCVQRQLDVPKGSFTSTGNVLEGVSVEVAYTFHSRIQDVKVISATTTPPTYVALLETGEVCHSVTGILSYPNAKVISMNVIDGRLQLYLDTGVVRQHPL